MRHKIKIVSDGTPYGTTVECNGIELANVTRIDIKPIERGSLIEAVITFEQVELDMEQMDWESIINLPERKKK